MSDWGKYAKPGYSVNLMMFGPRAFFMDLGKRDERYAPRRTEVIEPPAPERWREYYAAQAGLAALNEYGGTYWCHCNELDRDHECKPTVHPPEPKRHWEWQETEDAWLDRCLALYDSEAAQRD